ncbi:MAG TPA: RES family NAD+ phosphorylase [Allosphingosinicella sp.]|nr:RES family NAD+ phosphorylase [Allosphingosinicella sp.]
MAQLLELQPRGKEFAAIHAFGRNLDELARTSASRAGRIPAGKHFCRAQVAHAEREDRHVGPIPGPALPERMMPRPDAASEGRANPEGIPRLYMADNRHTAIAEVRPWIGSLVSVAILRTTRDLKVVDCRPDDGGIMLFEHEPDGAEREAAIWTQVARAFREPVLRGDDRAGYAATQVIAELFEHLGYDGILYGSGFGKGSTNVVLFDTTAAEIIACEIHAVRDVTLDHHEIDNPYHVRKKEDGSTEVYRMVITSIGPVGGPMINLEDDGEADVIEPPSSSPDNP